MGKVKVFHGVIVCLLVGNLFSYRENRRMIDNCTEADAAVQQMEKTLSSWITDNLLKIIQETKQGVGKGIRSN